MITIIIPAYNESRRLGPTVTKLYDFCTNHLTEPWQVVVVDNNSSDNTSDVVRQLQPTRPHLQLVHEQLQGKGAAVFAGWQKYTGDVNVFMDADLATDLEALPRLIAAIRDGAAIAYGDRRHPESKLKRDPIRQLLSTGYSWLSRLWLGTKVRDLPCGFKAVSRDVVEKLLPQVANRAWFFDSELLLRAERDDHALTPIAITWHEVADSKASKRKIIWEYGKALWQIKHRLTDTPKPQQWPRMRDYASLLFLTVVLLTLTLPSVIGKNAYLGSDTISLSYPVFSFFDQMIDRGLLPLWTDNIYSGFPMFATNSGGALSPIVIALLYFTNWITAYHLFLVGGLLLAQWFMYAFCRTLKYNYFASILATLAYGYAAWNLEWSHLHVMVMPMAILPLSFFIAHQKRNRAGLAITIFSGFLLGLFLYTAQPQLTTYALLCAGIYAGYRAYLYKNYDSVFCFALFVAIGVTAAIPQWLPLYELIQNSPRTAGIPWTESIWESHITLAGLLNIFVPDLASSWSKTHLYVVWPTWMIAFFLLVKPQSWRVKGLQFFLGLLVFAFVSAMHWSPLFYIQNNLPILSAFRGPGRWMFIGVFALAVIAGHWWNNLDHSRDSRPINSWLRAGFIFSFIVTICMTIEWSFTRFMPHSLVVVAFTAALTIMYSIKTQSVRTNYNLRMAIVLLTAASCLVLGWRFTHHSQTLQAYQQPHWLTTTANDRVWSFASYFWYYAQKDVNPYQRILNNLSGNTSLIYNISTADGYDNAVNSRQANVNQLLHGYGSKVLARPEQRRGFNLETARGEFLAHKQFLDDAGVTIIISPIVLIHDQLLLKSEPPATPLWHYTNTSAAAWAYTTTTVTTTVSPSNLDAYIIARRDGVVIECAPNCPPTSPGTSTIQQIVEQPHLTIFNTESSSNQWLVVARSWDKDWHASIDSVPTTIYHANYLFQGIYLPAGDHVVELRYQPWITKIPGLRGWVYHE